MSFVLKKADIQKVREESDLFKVIETVVHDLKKSSGGTYRGTCPNCSNPDKKFYYVPSRAGKNSKALYKCHQCEIGGNDAIDFVQKYDNTPFPHSVRKVADICNIFIDEQKHNLIPKSNSSKDKFIDRQLEDSGIPKNTIKYTKRSGGNREELIEFLPGTKNKFNEPSEGDDMIIQYFDLNGNNVLYRAKKSNKEHEFFRIRFKNPELHKDKSGNAMKYWQPYGSGVHVFIPHEVRNLYLNRSKIKTLHFEEGEKKAKKKSIHGMPAIGFMGIHSIVSDGQLPYDIVRIIETCEVENIIFNLDSDWRDIKIKQNVSVDQRPKVFYSAIKKFRDYFRALAMQSIYLNIYVSSIKSSYGDKGSDDLLCGKLKGKEKQLLQDFKEAMIKADGLGQFIELYNVSEMQDFKIKEMLFIHSNAAFAKYHLEELKELPKFKIGSVEYKINDEDQLELAQPLMKREMFWEKQTITRGGKDHVQYNFRYVGLVNFLTSRGFSKYWFGGKNNYIYTHLENNVVKEVNSNMIRDYVRNFVEEAELPEPILEMIYRGGDQYLSERKLYNIKFRTYPFIKPEDFVQYFYFKSRNEEGEKYKSWKINKDGIEELQFTDLSHTVWNDKINPVDVILMEQPLFKIKRLDNNEFRIEFTNKSKECQFLRYISCTSIFNKNTKNVEYSGKDWMQKIDELDEDERIEHDRHFLSKVTAIGYLLHDYRDSSVLKAVIPMDGKQSEIGSSNGRTGKSLFGMALREVIPTVILNGKRPKLHENPHIFSKLDERTRLIFIDDCTVNFNFEFFFPAITGLISVNPKGKDEFDLDIDKAPKLLLTTNHAFNGDGTSFEDRQHVVVFSDYFNDIHKPINEFGNRFFEDWDQMQYSYFYNFLALCLKTYFIYKREFNGPIPAPMEEVRLRKLRQQMGEEFLTWATEYYDRANNLNKRVVRKEAFEACISSGGSLKRYLTQPKFKKKILAYCQYKGLVFNPEQPKRDKKGNMLAANGGPDKSGGIEYFTLAESHRSKDNPQVKETPF